MEFERHRIDFISKDDVVQELKRVAKILGGRSFGVREFDNNSNACKHTKVLSFFKTWEAALAEIGIVFNPERRPRKDKVSDEDLVFEIARIWRELGHRPSRAEWDTVETQFGYSTICKRFEGWINACNEAYPFILTSPTEVSNGQLPRIGEDGKIKRPHEIIQQEDKRGIPLRIRLKVFKRDHYKCILCGRNPASDSKVELHVDHIVPFSKGGKTVEENLRTLCLECNLGKGNADGFNTIENRGPYDVPRA